MSELPEPALQLYTIREALSSDSDAAFRRVRESGIRYVELFDLVGLEHVWRRLPDFGLTAISAHADLVDTDLARVFDVAAELMVPTIVAPHVEPARWQTGSDVAQIAAQLSEAASLAASRELRVGYHNHHFEFEHQVNGVTAYEFFCAQVDSHVVLELDIYWAAVAGQDLRMLISSLVDRIGFLHVKDGSADGDTSAQCVLGNGEVDILSALVAAPAARRIIEFDAYSGDLWSAIEDSRDWLDSHDPSRADERG